MSLKICDTTRSSWLTCALRDDEAVHWVSIRAGTRLFKNRRLIEYLKEGTRSARLGTRSVLGAAGKFEI